MARLRQGQEMQTVYPYQRPLRIVASGTLFQTTTLSVPFEPTPSEAARAHSVEKTRGGSANIILSVLAQFSSVDAILVAPLGGNEDGQAILRDLEREGVNTRFCKIWDEYGVPSAWVLHAADTDSQTVINHNPLPDITHEDFIKLLGPLLAPENYYFPSPSYGPSASALAPPASNGYGSSSPQSRSAPPSPNPSQIRSNPHSPAPFDWIHVEGRSVKTTLNNIIGVDGLARERKWRSHCVFSVDVGRRGRQGVEALIPHADVIFLNKSYAQAHSAHYATTPRAFLLSLTQIAPPHALLVAHWGSEGAAVLSLPTREYFQSSGWVEQPGSNNDRGDDPAGRVDGNESVRSGSAYWAAPGSRAFSSSNSSAFTAGDSSRSRDDDNESQGTEKGEAHAGEAIDEVGAQDAFIAGMIYALSRKILPGHPYTPSAAFAKESPSSVAVVDERQRWRLDECLRFATELSGRKAKRKNWDGLADEMARAGWFE
ncbi:hypothetical protein FIBSPDRAFT_918986 [Athelia psychrophila]|uniref:Carbohydrate kinase PfkB domain-containing protein n=1 Tax=Athelia psychrophila TaxID=1759441 RepID=A0A166MAE4_9AGAM|nr:hypothetical protein FIBSPDRAFT_918986 [Fibularhizoctonia sp. CBS 109695]